MKYGDYFLKISELYPIDREKAERLLREAEKIASPHISYHLILCAKSWQEVFLSPDNALRCLLEAECRCYAVREFIDISDWQRKILNNDEIAFRCLKKAANLAVTEEDFMRLEEVFDALQQDHLAAYCRSRYAAPPNQNKL